MQTRVHHCSSLTRRHFGLLLIAPILLLSQGCATVRDFGPMGYYGSRPSTEVARIVALQPGPKEKLSFIWVDDMKTYSFWSMSTDPAPRTILVPPGQHNLVLGYVNSNPGEIGVGYPRLSVDVRSGVTYHIVPIRESHNRGFVLEEAAAGDSK